MSNPGGWALNGDGLTVDGYLDLRSAEVTGEVYLFGAHPPATHALSWP